MFHQRRLRLLAGPASPFATYGDARIRSHNYARSIFMIHAVRFNLVAPEKVCAFTAMFHYGGLYRELTRHLQPGLIAIDLLHSLELDAAFVTLEFWLSVEAYRAAQNAPAQSVLIKLL
jgi:hypothetical protein